MYSTHGQKQWPLFSISRLRVLHKKDTNPVSSLRSTLDCGQNWSDYSVSPVLNLFNLGKETRVRCKQLSGQTRIYKAQRSTSKYTLGKGFGTVFRSWYLCYMSSTPSGFTVEQQIFACMKFSRILGAPLVLSQDILLVSTSGQRGTEIVPPWVPYSRQSQSQS